MTYIKTLTAPLIIIAGLALLTACGGGATPAEETAVDCAETPFDSPDMCEDEKNTACQMHGTNVEAGGHASCDDLIRTDCVANPFMYDGCDTLDDKIRTDFCAILPANRFNAQCISRDIGDDGDRDTACQMYGTNVGAGGHATCDGRIRTACIANPFEYKGCDTLDDKIRTDFCKMEQHIFTHAECMNLDNINDIRMTYCSVTDIFHARCLDNTYGGDGERDTACQAHGTDANAGGHASCDGRIRTACVLNPFMHLGCDTLDADKEDNIRTKFCAILPTNRFNAQCILRDIGDDDDRDDTCEMYGITSPMGHSTCDGRIRDACVTNPFEHLGCNSLEEKIRTDFCAILPANRFNEGCIDRELGDNERDNFCGILPTNRFNQDCLDNGLGDDGERDNACLGSEAGDPEHPSCANRPGVILACKADPFLVTTPGNTGCENLDTIVSIRDIHCGTSPNSDIDRCTVNYDDWAASFGAGKAPLPTPNATRRNEFLNAGTDALDAALDEVFPDEHSETATALHLGELKGGDATDGVAYFIFQDSGQQYHYAGLDSGTDLGAPSFQETGTAIWKGRFNATKLDQATEFELEITFGGAGDVAGSIAAFVPSGDDHFLLTGDYDANGVISGKVNYGAFTTGTRTPTATRVDNGILTGLIGRQGAVGVFLSGTGTKDNITGGTGIATGFAGGFVANPFQGNVSYSDWVTFSSPPATPAAAPSSGNLNQFVQTIRNDVINATHAGERFNVNLGSLDGDPADGFNVHYVTATDDYLVGLSSTTSLGVALKAQPVGTWLGSFVVYESGVATTTPFELTVDFASRSIDATVTNTLYSFVNTSFGSNDGVIRGNVNRGDITGNLAGLIGLGGAVGVFHSDNNLEFSFAGGFVAAPPPPAPCVLAGNCVANHAAWLASFGASPPPATRAESDAGTNVFGSFLNLGEGVRAISNTGFTTGTLGEFTLTLDGDGTNGMHGVTYVEGGNATSNSRQAFVAVLPTTNLGAPLVGPPVITTWPGTYHNFAFGDFQVANFLINFGAKTITAAPVDDIGTTTDFDLRFNDAGVITGNVTRGVSVTARGLIGEVGLVGVYVDTTTGRPTGDSVLYGGFIADNPNN